MTETGNRIHKLFENRNREEKVMSLYLTAGYPEPGSTAELILGFEKNGADLIEIGIPFSDPLADGPTIQYSSKVAIEHGSSIDGILDMVQDVRKRSGIPLVLMGYLNPVLHYGVEKFCRNASQAGVDGLIIPDLPLDDPVQLSEQARLNGIAVIYLVAPNTDDKRMQQVDHASDGFVYCVSVTGVTGGREGDEIAESVDRFIERVGLNVKKNPVMIGFGIQSFEDARRVTRHSDGFIVGSALIEKIRKHYPENGWENEVFEFVKQLKFGNIGRS